MALNLTGVDWTNSTQVEELIAEVIPLVLPASLTLPHRLATIKYLVVCILTIMAWDVLVMASSTWRLLRTPEWSLLKVIFFALRVVMPIEFVVVTVALFQGKWDTSVCSKLSLFEPIVTAFLITLCAATHAVRVTAIFDHSGAIGALVGAGTVAVLAATGTGAAFHHAIPLQAGQGCLSGPRHPWVGIYWAIPTAFFLITAVLALVRTLQSNDSKLPWWKIALRDGLNYYGFLALVQVANLIFWFVAKPSNPADPIRVTMVPITAILTTILTMRLILLSGARGSLSGGGQYAGSANGTARPGTTIIANRAGTYNHHQSMRAPPPTGFSIEDMRSKGAHEWDATSTQDEDGKDQLPMGMNIGPAGVTVHVERETVDPYGPYGGYKS